MPDDPIDHGKTGSKTEPVETAGLERPLQEHLGQQLRATYNTLDLKPAYLGDPAIPPEFDEQIYRIEQSQIARERGVEAVEEALRDIAEHPPTPERNR